MTLQDLKVYLAIYWYNQTILQYIIGILCILAALLLITVYYYPTVVTIFFLIVFVACLVLTFQQYLYVQTLKSGFPPQTQTTVTTKYTGIRAISEFLRVAL